jgi:hypothetical protein
MEQMKRLATITLTTVLLILACVSSPPTVNTVNVDTAIAGTQTAVQVHSTLMPVPTDTPTISPTLPSIPTETPLAPVSFTYEGVTIDCSCINCYCITGNDVLFSATITISVQGDVTGTFDQYIPSVPDIALTGTKTNIFGSYQDDEGYTEFIGYLSNDLRYLNATLSFNGAIDDGTSFSGKRLLLLERK